MKLYVYCLSERVPAYAIEDMAGVACAPVRFHSCRSLTAVVSEMGSEPVGVTRENVLAHDRVVRSLLSETTPLPFRFGMIVSPDELDRYVEARKAAIGSLFDRVRGAVEMGVKVIWDKEAIRSESEETGDDRQPTGPGTAFLLARRRELEAGEAMKRRAESIAGWMDNRLNSVVRETIVSLRPADALVVVAAHLVERARLDEYRERLKHMRRERSDLRFLTSGAWPPYSFAHIRSSEQGRFWG